MSLSRRILPTTQAMWDRIEELESQLTTALENDSDLPDWSHGLFIGQITRQLFKLNAPAWVLTYWHAPGHEGEWADDRIIAISNSVAGFQSSTVRLLPVHEFQTGSGHGGTAITLITVGTSTYVTVSLTNWNRNYLTRQRYLIVPTMTTANWLLSNDIPISLIYTATDTESSYNTNNQIPDFEYENDPYLVAMGEGDWRDNFDLETKGLNPTYAYQS